MVPHWFTINDFGVFLSVYFEWFYYYVCKVTIFLKIYSLLHLILSCIISIFRGHILIYKFSIVFLKFFSFMSLP